MISDFVKGKKKFDYPSSVIKGINLHRAIDHFTDTHPIVKQAKEFFRPVYRLYSGALVDIVFDHFLAIEPSEFSEEILMNFTRQVYLDLEGYTVFFPDRFSHIFPYMKEQNWLFSYHTREGIKKSLAGLIRRAAFLSDSLPAFEIFEQHYQPIQELFRPFWVQLKNYAYEQFLSMPEY